MSRSIDAESVTGRIFDGSLEAPIYHGPASADTTTFLRPITDDFLPPQYERPDGTQRYQEVTRIHPATGQLHAAMEDTATGDIVAWNEAPLEQPVGLAHPSQFYRKEERVDHKGFSLAISAADPYLGEEHVMKTALEIAQKRRVQAQGVYPLASQVTIPSQLPASHAQDGQLGQPAPQQSSSSFIPSQAERSILDDLQSDPEEAEDRLPWYKTRLVKAGAFALLVIGVADAGDNVVRNVGHWLLPPTHIVQPEKYLLQFDPLAVVHDIESFRNK